MFSFCQNLLVTAIQRCLKFSFTPGHYYVMGGGGGGGGGRKKSSENYQLTRHFQTLADDSHEISYLIFVENQEICRESCLLL